MPTLLREAIGVAVCAGIFVGADLVGRRVPLPLPPGIVGALLLAALMLARALPLASIAPGADRLLRHLGLFFVPAAVLALKQRDVVWPALLPIVALVAVSTTIGLIVAAAITERLARGDRAPGRDEAAAREEEPGT